MVVAGDGGGKLKCLTLRCDIYTPEGSAWLSIAPVGLAVLAVNAEPNVGLWQLLAEYIL